MTGLSPLKDIAAGTYNNKSEGKAPPCGGPFERLMMRGVGSTKQNSQQIKGFFGLNRKYWEKINIFWKPEAGILPEEKITGVGLSPGNNLMGEIGILGLRSFVLQKYNLYLHIQICTPKNTFRASRLNCAGRIGPILRHPSTPCYGSVPRWDGEKHSLAPAT